MKNSLYYLGSFPPPYGGVTLKNQLMYDTMCPHIPIAVRKHNKTISQVIHIIKGILFGKGFIIGSGSTQKLLLLTKVLGRICPHKMRNSIVFVMGGSMADDLKRKPSLHNDFKQYRWMYIETAGMLEKMRNMGFENVSRLPNCRKKGSKETSIRENSGKLRCIFFSLISRDKGTDTVLEAAKQLPQVQFDFYGVLEPSYAEEFQKALQSVPNAQYHGVFQVNGDNVYEKLNEYDLLLLPTRWVNEGVPGVLVEAKIAAVPAIVSDICYNSEIVENGVSGVVLEENTAQALAEAIAALNGNQEQLYRLKEGALRSAEDYFVENYLDDILSKLDC